MYEHALATIAVCEALILTGDPKLRLNAQGGINHIVKAQHANGGWRYNPGEAGDTSSTGWQFTALKLGQQAGLKIPKTTLPGVTRFLDAVAGQGGSVYRYSPTEGAFLPPVSAVGLLMREYQGWGPDNAALAAGIEYLMKPDNLPRPQLKNLYYYYYATQVLHNVGGKNWEQWNDRMRFFLLDTQEKSDETVRASFKGSWAPQGYLYAGEGGRLFMTSMALLTLEVYYRHVPLYRRDLVGTRE